MKEQIVTTFKQIQDEICNALTQSSGQKFDEDNWTYDHGKGGGRTRITQGEVIEKGGVNFSSVEGKLNEKIAEKMKQPPGQDFFATGVSLVIHPQNPFVPTIHMNIRFFLCGDQQWFGGGTDLTPYYPFQEDVVHFHKAMKAACDRHHPDSYPKFKKWCDDYFYIKHRKEARGVGGIFFDYLKEEPEKTFSFVKDVGKTFIPAYIPILEKRKNDPFAEKERDFQLYRRGRYVEFNLVYDRGTLFGLETEGRTESILMSLPSLVSWKYNWKAEPGSPESKIYEYLQPRDWANLD